MDNVHSCDRWIVHELIIVIEAEKLELSISAALRDTSFCVLKYESYLRT
jgi:hypothetical protein